MPNMFVNEIRIRTWKNTRDFCQNLMLLLPAASTSDVMFFGDHAQSKHCLLIVGVGVCMPRWWQEFGSNKFHFRKLNSCWKIQSSQQLNERADLLELSITITKSRLQSPCQEFSARQQWKPQLPTKMLRPLNKCAQRPSRQETKMRWSW